MHPEVLEEASVCGNYTAAQEQPWWLSRTEGWDTNLEPSTFYSYSTSRAPVRFLMNELQVANNCFFQRWKRGIAIARKHTDMFYLKKTTAPFLRDRSQREQGTGSKEGPPGSVASSCHPTRNSTGRGEQHIQTPSFKQQLSCSEPGVREHGSVNLFHLFYLCS